MDSSLPPSDIPKELPKERRRRSYAGLLDSAIRNAGQLAASPDLRVRNLAAQILADLLQVRRELPVRRRTDAKPRRP